MNEAQKGSATRGGTEPRSHPAGTDRKMLALVGAANVGKSVLFNNLTGAYVNVSNYPGTTV